MSRIPSRGGRSQGQGRDVPVRGGRGRGQVHRDVPVRGREGRGREGRGRSYGTTVSDANQPTTEEFVLSTGLSLVGLDARRQNVSTKLNNKRFRSFFGMGPKSVAELYDKILDKFGESDWKKIFMALNWLKLYDPEGVLAARWNLSEETLRVYIREYVSRIASFRPNLIVWGDFGDEVFIVSIDGTHCPIFEPRTDPSSKWFSHKFNGAGVAYELAIAIHSNRLVWINGPFPASRHDITIFRSPEDPATGLMARIPEGKRAIGDSGYGGEPNKVSVSRSDDDKETKKFKARVKSRHETFNGRLKNFRVLSIPFRNGYDRHQEVFEACCVCMQLELQNGNGLFDV
jgi:hypothetical protein